MVSQAIDIGKHSYLSVAKEKRNRKRLMNIPICGQWHIFPSHRITIDKSRIPLIGAIHINADNIFFRRIKLCRNRFIRDINLITATYIWMKNAMQIFQIRAFVEISMFLHQFLVQIRQRKSSNRRIHFNAIGFAQFACADKIRFQSQSNGAIHHRQRRAFRHNHNEFILRLDAQLIHDAMLQIFRAAKAANQADIAARTVLVECIQFEQHAAMVDGLVNHFVKHRRPHRIIQLQLLVVQNPFAWSAQKSLILKILRRRLVHFLVGNLSKISAFFQLLFDELNQLSWQRHIVRFTFGVRCGTRIFHFILSFVRIKPFFGTTKVVEQHRILTGIQRLELGQPARFQNVIQQTNEMAINIA
mmetsp:Transcript_32378/g.52432  ORF Transcript_32378/g.52432 Transcript_32378/m.52432 type:complete len:358 (-) Transcript_32378:373-1446(-)